MPECMVYVLACSEATRVGLSRAPERRLSYLYTEGRNAGPFAWLYDRKGNLAGARYWYMAPFVDMEAARQSERYAHWLLRRSNIYGEWFAVPPDLAAGALEQGCRAVAFGRRAPFSRVMWCQGQAIHSVKGDTRPVPLDRWIKRQARRAPPASAASPDAGPPDDGDDRGRTPD